MERQRLILPSPENPTKILYERFLPVSNKYGSDGTSYGVSELKTIDDDVDDILAQGGHTLRVVCGGSGNGKTTFVSLLTRRRPSMSVVDYDAARLRLGYHQVPLTEQQQRNTNILFGVGLSASIIEEQDTVAVAPLFTGFELWKNDRRERAGRDRAMSIAEDFYRITLHCDDLRPDLVRTIYVMAGAARMLATYEERRRDTDPYKTQKLEEQENDAMIAFLRNTRDIDKVDSVLDYLLEEGNEFLLGSLKIKERVKVYVGARLLQNFDLKSHEVAIIESLPGPNIPRDMTPQNCIFDRLEQNGMLAVFKKQIEDGDLAA